MLCSRPPTAFLLRRVNMARGTDGLSTTALNTMTTLLFTPALHPGTLFSALIHCHAGSPPSKKSMSPVAIAAQTHRQPTA